MDLKRHLQAAQGYLELGMFEDAIAELDQLPESERDGEFATCFRLDIYNATEKWQEAARVAREGIERHPDCSHLYIMGAYAIRRAESLDAGKEFLLKGHLCMEEGKVETPMFWFNLGCYHSRLGDQENALSCVGNAVKIDANYKKLALVDPDLEPLWDSFAVSWP